MSKVLILYGSITGNTQAAAIMLQQRLVEQYPDGSFELANVNETVPAAVSEFGAVIFGTSTWDENNNPDTEDFFIRVEQDAPDYSRTAFAIFGLGDTAYVSFCGSLPQVKTALEQRGAKVDPKFFEIDGYPTDEIAAQLGDWASAFLAGVA